MRFPNYGVLSTTLNKFEIELPTVCKISTAISKYYFTKVPLLYFKAYISFVQSNLFLISKDLLINIG